jgi:hypothetical protein
MTGRENVRSAVVETMTMREFAKDVAEGRNVWVLEDESHGRRYLLKEDTAFTLAKTLRTSWDEELRRPKDDTNKDD